MEISDLLKEAIVSYYEGKLTQAQAEELLAWIEKDEINRLYFIQLGMVWQAAESLVEVKTDKNAVFKTIGEKITERGIRRLPGREIHIRVSTFFRVAAALLAIVAIGIAGLSLFRKNQSPVSPVSFVETSAPKGSKSLITLPDGTSIWLNAATRLRYPVDYGTTNRNVYLEGEAYFTVAKNTKLPFRVYTSDITVTALGTVFNVKAYPEEHIIETTLEEGRVRIDPVLDEQKRNPGRSIILKPNQNAIFRKNMKEAEVTDKTHPVRTIEIKPEANPEPIRVDISTVQDVRLYTSWKDTRWLFKNEKLGTLAAKLERRYDVTFLFVDEELKDFAFTGTLKEESLEQVLAAIRFTAPIQYEIDFKEVRLFEDKSSKKEYQKILTP